MYQTAVLSMYLTKHGISALSMKLLLITLIMPSEGNQLNFVNCAIMQLGAVENFFCMDAHYFKTFRFLTTIKT